MILRLQLSRIVSPLVLFVALVSIAIGLSCTSQVVADDEATAEELPKAGVVEFVITVDGKPVATKSISRVLSKLEAVRKAEAVPLLVAINVNETVREFTDSEDARRVVKDLSEILDAAKKLKIQLGELGRFGVAPSQSQQSTTPEAQTLGRRQQYQPVNARDGDDGYGIGGGLGGPGGGGVGIASQQQGLDLRRAGAGTREMQIEFLRKRLIEVMAPSNPTDQTASTVASEPVPKEGKLGEATLYSRMTHRDYQKATFSFEFGLRDDPTYLHANDWDLQYGNGGDHFHVTMVADDRSRIVDLGEIDWEQLDTSRLAKLPPHPQPRREFVPTVLGHVYMVHTVDRNTDLYALFRVEAVDPPKGTCDITWRLVDAPK